MSHHIPRETLDDLIAHRKRERAKVHAHGAFGEWLADAVATGMGCWRFIIIQTAIVIVWMVLNTAGWFLWHWDEYPFILLNLAFSTQAAYAAPIIMMSQNRQATKDRKRDDIEADEVARLVGIGQNSYHILETLHALQEQQMLNHEEEIGLLKSLKGEPT